MQNESRTGLKEKKSTKKEESEKIIKYNKRKKK
jgi:hypothetical protein